MGFPLEAYPALFLHSAAWEFEALRDHACKTEAVSNHFGTIATLQRIKITWLWMPCRKPSRNRYLENISTRCGCCAGVPRARKKEPWASRSGPVLCLCR